MDTEILPNINQLDIENTPELLENMHSLMELDSDINSKIIKLRDSHFMEDLQTPHGSFITGSIFESCSIAKWFHPNPEKHELELDMQHITCELSESDLKYIDHVPGKPDNVKIRMDRKKLLRNALPGIRKYLEPHLNTGFQEDEVESQYIDPHMFRRIAQGLYRFNRNNFDQDVAELFKMFKMNICIQDMPENVSEKGVAITSRFKVNHLDRDFNMIFSIDQVIAFQCKFWPEVAREFDKRLTSRTDMEQRWPGLGKRQEIMAGGCDLVPKPSPDGDIYTEWRWSFARAEKQLMTWLSAAQIRCYFVAKIIFYRYVKPIDSDKIHSYWMKMSMLWLAEELQPSHSLWDDGNLAKSVLVFYLQLLDMLRKWRLPHFFIPSHSLLRYVNDNRLKSALIDKITNITENLHEYLPKHEEIRQVLELLKKPNQFLDELITLGELMGETLIERNTYNSYLSKAPERSREVLSADNSETKVQLVLELLNISNQFLDEVITNIQRQNNSIKPKAPESSKKKLSENDSEIPPQDLPKLNRNYDRNLLVGKIATFLNTV